MIPIDLSEKKDMTLDKNSQLRTMISPEDLFRTTMPARHMIFDKQGIL